MQFDNCKLIEFNMMYFSIVAFNLFDKIDIQERENPSCRPERIFPYQIKAQGAIGDIIH